MPFGVSSSNWPAASMPVAMPRARSTPCSSSTTSRPAYACSACQRGRNGASPSVANCASAGVSAFSDAASVSVRFALAHAIDSAAGGSPLANAASRARSASTCAATASAPRTLMPKPITTAVASAVVHTVSIRIPASLPTMRDVPPSSAAVSSRSFGHLSATRERASSGSVARPSASATPIAMLRPPSASTGRGTMQPTEHSSALPGCANHGRPWRPRPAVCSNATRTSGAGSACAVRGSVFRRAARSALVEPVAATMSSGHARGAASRCASSRLRAMCAPSVSGVSGEVGVFMALIVATSGGLPAGADCASASPSREPASPFVVISAKGDHGIGLAFICGTSGGSTDRATRIRICAVGVAARSARGAALNRLAGCAARLVAAPPR
ncbi:hypothetical protein Bmul_0400 [Burkholderia multivorans ATCC 17616]|nr:hypothetical protein Bmul_0400 [Burkholderia multivorans ATCC 17616]